jgi:hypothetical protein
MRAYFLPSFRMYLTFLKNTAKPTCSNLKISDRFEDIKQ